MGTEVVRCKVAVVVAAASSHVMFIQTDCLTRCMYVGRYLYNLSTLHRYIGDLALRRFDQQTGRIRLRRRSNRFGDQRYLPYPADTKIV